MGYPEGVAARMNSEAQKWINDASNLVGLVVRQIEIDDLDTLLVGDAYLVSSNYNTTIPFGTRSRIILVVLKRLSTGSNEELHSNASIAWYASPTSRGTTQMASFCTSHRIELERCAETTGWPKVTCGSYLFTPAFSFGASYAIWVCINTLLSSESQRLFPI